MHAPPQARTALTARAALSALPIALLVGCGGSSEPGLPQLAAATPGTLQSCSTLASRINFANTTITAANTIAAGTLTVAGTPVREHCQVTGKMFQRVSPVDGKSYAIGFEMRLPMAWNGRFFYQGNGGIDGSVVPATGAVNGGGGLNNALNMGFAVISSDAGHAGSMGPNFGIDPQARLDFGYQAVAKLTPMAKSAIQTAYGKAPDRSYFGGCSNGGRHTMVAASRFVDQYDGYLVGNPGFNLPKAAIASIASGKIYASLASTPGDLSTGFTTAERALVSKAVLAKCDALDGSTDGLVQDTGACQAAFNLDRDVPTCSGGRDGSCLSAEQKTGIAKIFSGPTTSTGSKIYTSFPYDAGLAGGGYGFWEFTAPLVLDSGGVGLIWSVPPEDAATFNGPVFALTGNVDTMVARVNATNAVYTESAMSFMTPPNPSNLSAMKNRGAKMMLYHGTSDPIFSSDDTTAWYDNLRNANNGDASNFARFYRVPGMNHCSGGPATDQFDMLTPLVNWVEKGEAPDSVLASVRGAGNAGGVNADVPATWSANRTRPLCAYPKVARYNGSGDIESAMSFMTPPNPSNLSAMKNRGAKMMLYHGTSDPIFSSDDTTAWYDALRNANNGDASNFARFYRVPGMNHCSGGPATDQFDMLTPLVNWVEKGEAPDSVLASVRGAGNAGGVNADVPATWSANRTRPLCAYPKVARYNGSGDIESASSFSCK